MDQKTQLKVEFFELCRILNKSNLKTNQKTEIIFFIELESGKRILFATTNHKTKIQLITKIGKNPWIVANFSGQNLLESSIAALLNTFHIEQIEAALLTKMIKSFIFQKFDEL